jgi:hypothetical protein
LTVPSSAAFNFGTGDFTLESWVYWTSTATSVGGQRIFLQGVAGTTEIGVNYNATKFDIDINNVTRFSYTYAISAGQWYHIALVRRSTNVYELFVNGTSQGTNNYTYSQNANNFIIGGLTWASNYGTSGYISNVRILKGTALYTASFTPSTSPLTAIANTALLTCNSATIVDSSTNNFTITNNNSAAVSSTTPFTIAVLGSTMKMRKVFADTTYMIATGGDLITTSGSYKVHTFTTVGTSSFVVSNLGSNPSVEYLAVGGGGGGGADHGGGGGGGAFILSSYNITSSISYTVIIGQGGSGGSNYNSGQAGGASVFNNITAAGGGLGIGSSGYTTYFGAAGNSYAGAGGTNAYASSGAGSNGGNGGAGTTSNISGTNLSYSSGGGGGPWGGSAGSAGGPEAGAGAGGAAVANRGGGGGGGQTNNGPGVSGGSGIVIIKYRYTA